MRRLRAISKYAIIGIVVVLIIIAAVAIFLMQAPPPEEKPSPSPTTPTTTPPTTTTPTTTEKPTKVELTGDFEKDVVEVGKALEANGVSEVTYSVWSGGDPNSVMRVLGIVEAANRINKIWSDNGVNVRIEIETRYERDPGAIYNEYLSKQPLGQAGDFFVNSYIYISTLACE